MLRILSLGVALLALAMCKPSSTTPAIPTKQFTKYELHSDSIGTIDGVTIYDGGYSALTFDQEGNLLTLNDRGPNLDAENYANKPAKRFPLPSYSPAISRLSVDSTGVRIARDIELRSADSSLFSGLPIPSTDRDQRLEIALDEKFEKLANTPLGIDSEGLTVSDSLLWIADEYAPSILQFEASTMAYQTRYSPLADAPSQRLPKWLLQRQPNLGFEGLAYSNGYLYAALQGPLSPAGASPRTTLVRILRIDTETGAVRHFIYSLDAVRRKIGDLAMHPDGRLLVLEHGYDRYDNWSAQVYAISLGSVTLQVKSADAPERFSDDVSALLGGVLVAPKVEFLDLLKAGYPSELKKPEGLAVDTEGKIYVINDNDYGIDSPTSNGRAVETGLKSYLMVLE